MLNDIATMIWKEWRELLRLGGSRRRAIMRMLFSVGVLYLWSWVYHDALRAPRTV